MLQNVQINLMSFGHSFGVPKHADLLYSVRHLQTSDMENHREYDGRHARLQNELLSYPEYVAMLKTIKEQVISFIPNFKGDSMTVAIGCQQGQHRSVALVELLAEQLNDTCQVQIAHRDLQRTRFDKKKQRERVENRDRKYAMDSEHD